MFAKASSLVEWYHGVRGITNVSLFQLLLSTEHNFSKFKLSATKIVPEEQ